jgi:hypothetical protein
MSRGSELPEPAHRWKIMEAASHHNRRAVCGALCLVAVLVVLIGGVARADAATHHRSTLAVAAVATGDNHAGAMRMDQPGLAAAAAAILVLAGLFAARGRRSTGFLRRLTAGSPAPRGPPVQAH